MLLKQPSENVFVSDTKIVGDQIHNMLIYEDPLAQVKFLHLFKVTVLNLHVIMIWQEIELIISEYKVARVHAPIT